MRPALIACLLFALLPSCSCPAEPVAGDGALADGAQSEGLFFQDGKGTPREKGGGGPDFAVSDTDWDGDGLSNDDEKKIGTDPWVRDSDGDGKLDLEEVGSNPAAPKDGDGDTLIDAVEPSNFDSDKDGTPDDQDKDPPLCNGIPRIYVMHVSTKTLTFTKDCSPYRVMGFLWMKSDAALKIAPGVRVEFGPGAEIIIGDTASKASFEATGAETDGIVLTSLAATPRKGDWRGLVVEQATTLSLTWTKLEWAGGKDPTETDPQAALYVKMAQSITLSSMTMEHVDGVGIHASFYTDPGPLFPSFSNCTFTDLSAAPALLNVRHLGEIGIGNKFAPAGAGAVIRVNEGLVAKDATWRGLDVPYLLEEQSLTVDAQLILNAGVKLILPTDAIINVGSKSSTAGLAANGSSLLPITFQTQNPAPGSWVGIVMSSGSHKLANTFIKGAGKGSWKSGMEASIYLDQTASLLPINVSISESAGYGVYYYRPGIASCDVMSGNGYTFTGTFPGTTAHPGCKFLCQDDAGARCVVGP